MISRRASDSASRCQVDVGPADTFSLAPGQDRFLRTAERPPSWTTLLQRADPERGSGDYKRLSAGAHTNLALLQGAWVEVVDAQEHADPALVQAHTWYTSLTDAYYTLLACGRRWRLKG